MAAQWAIIVAGGSGSRMHSEIPKQFLMLSGLPILVHTLRAFHTTSNQLKIVVVLPADQIGRWQKIVNDYQVDIPHVVVSGGNTRFQSVKNGLDAIQEADGIVAIHDGVRPFVSSDLINNCFKKASAMGSAVAAVPLKESIREMQDDQQSKSVDRTRYRMIQTPQTFRLSLIKKAFKVKEETNFTDDASVYESDGGTVYLVSGDYSNRKITTPEDLIWAESYLEGKEKK